MFHRGFLFLRILGALLIIGALIAAGTGIFQAGQAQGYALGLAASGKEVPVPQPYYGYGYWGPHFFPFSPLFGFFIVGGLFFLVFFVFGGLFRRHAWNRSPMGPYGPWGWGPQGPQGPQSPTGPGGPTGQPPSAPDQPAQPGSNPGPGDPYK